MDNHSSSVVKANKEITSIPIRLFVLIGFVGLLTALIVGYGFYTGQRIITDYAPQVDAAMEIKLEATLAHLWFEEFITGDITLEMIEIWEHFDLADWYIKAMLEGGENPEGTFYPIDDPIFQTKIKILQSKLKEFRNITQIRLESLEEIGIGSTIDQDYDELFKDFINLADEVETQIQLDLSRDLNSFRITQVVMITVCILLALLVSIVFGRYERNRIKNYKTVLSMNKKLEKEILTRKRTENRLKNSEEKYRSLFDNMLNGFALHEMKLDKENNPVDYVFLEMNKSFERLTGFKRKNTINKKVTEVVKGIENDDFDWIGTYGKVALNGEELKFEQYLEQLNRWYYINAYSPKEGFFATILEDISERKQTEMKLKETNQSLEEMVYITSHDLQVPLISMEGYASELLNTYRDQLDEEGIYCLERLKANSQRMHQLVLNLLDISRLNTKKYPYETFNPQNIVENILADLMLLIDEQNAKINVNNTDIPLMTGDRLRLDGVFRKLITNALNYGGKNITIGCEKNIYFVKDDGIGIPDDQLEKIFSPGERLKMLAVNGTGMGLTFCKKVIKQHGGKIWAESGGKNNGSTFYFYLKS